MKKRILTLILSLTTIFAMSTMSLSVTAKTVVPTITLESIEAKKGQNVSVKVSIENNPGIWGMDLKIAYDKAALTLTSVDNGDFYQDGEWTKGNLNGDVYILSYEASGFDNITTQSGILATLNFKVSDTAKAGDYAIKATYKAGDIINVSFDEIDFTVVSGGISITDMIYGDVNNDGSVTVLDATMLQKYLAGLVSFSDEQLAVADTNGDGNITVLDATAIQKYLANLVTSLG